MDEEELYRRAEDRAWRTSIQDDYDDLAAKLADIDELLHGDRANRDSGLVGQFNAIENKINSVLSILHPDSTGHGGLIHEHNQIYNKIVRKERDLAAWLLFWAKVIGVIGGITGIAISSWPTISRNWKEASHDMKQLDRQINKVKHPHVPRYIPKQSEEGE